MSVLRRAKLRTPDGIESIEYPLGVDAENVEVANGENLSQRLARIDEDLEKNEEDITAVSELAGTNKQNIGANEIRIDALERRSASVDKKPYYFDTVADMKAYQGLKEGDMAITLGYYEKNDMGMSTYNITNDTNDDDYVITLKNNKKAKLITSTSVNIKQFGAFTNNQNDDFDYIQNAINYAHNHNLILYGLKNKYSVISKTLIIPSEMQIFNLYLKAPDNSENLTDNYLVFINTEDGKNWKDSYNKFVNLKLDNISMINNSSNIINGIKCLANIQLLNVYSYKLNKTIDMNTSLYIDMIKIENVQVSNKISSDYAIQIPYLGDCFSIRNAHIYDTIGDNNFIETGSARKPSTIENVINGHIHCKGGLISIKNYHGEGDKESDIKLDNGDFSLDTLIIAGNNKPGIILSNAHANISNFLSQYNLSIDNTTDIDIELTNNSSVDLSNSFKTLQFPRAEQLARSAIKTNINDLTYSNNQAISNDEYLFINNIVRKIDPRYPHNKIQNVSYGTWKINVGTFYYMLAPLYDPIRLIQTQYKQSTHIEKTADNLHCIQLLSVPRGVPIRVMRGNSPTSYTNYVDVITYDGSIIDNGQICNGKIWNTYEEQKSDIDGSYFLNSLRYNGDNVITFRNSLINLGEWKKGDIIYKDNFVKGESKGWICTESGTPGTWIELENY